MAHSESAGADGGAREALDKTNQAAGIAGTEVGEDVRDGDAVLPRLLGSAWTKRTTMRSFLVRRRSVGCTVAAVNGVGGDELRSGCTGERAEEGEEHGESERRSRRLRGVHSDVREAVSRQEVAAACGCARRACALAYWREEEGDRRAPRGLGRRLGRQVG